MSGRHANANRNSKTEAELLDSKILSTNERILKEAHDLYTNDDRGLIPIAQSLGLKLLAPRKKITVLLAGNHSAGKSSFINWYIEEHVQKTGVAIETQGFTLVTSGRKRESLTGTATLHLYRYLSSFAEIPGVTDYLSTEVSSSKHKKFPLITFIDTPGLVDGDMVYPFDVNKAVTWLGELADLILVFFDPIGQALCKRTLDIVENLNHRHPERIRFYLSKADEAGSEGDRQKVLMQIVQELCKRPGLNRAGFDMQTIYIPDEAISRNVRSLNQIDSLCRSLEQCIDHTIQKTLNTVEVDCDKIALEIDRRLDEDRDNREVNWRSKARGCCYAGVFFAFQLTLLIYLLAGTTSFDFVLSAAVDEFALRRTRYYLTPIVNLADSVSGRYQTGFFAIFLITSAVLWILAKRAFRLLPTLSRRERRQLLENREHVQTYTKNIKHCLYQEYLDQSINENEL